MNWNNNYKTKAALSASGRIDQLLQLLQITWDGDVISKSERDELVKNDLALKTQGFNLITPKGINYLLDLGLINP